MNTIKATLYKTDGTKEHLKISKSNSLEMLQKLVGGYIEVISLIKEFDALCGNWSRANDLILNEEGSLIGLPVNPWSQNIAYGTIWENETFKGDLILIDGRLP